MLTKFKSSAIHNLRIEALENKNNEGILIPKKILNIANVKNYQEVIITKIGAGSWKNRIKTFVVEGNDDDKVTVMGSITKFLDEGDLTCLIAEGYNDDQIMNQYHNNKIPIFDLGFDPNTNFNNTNGKLDLQYGSCIKSDVKIDMVEFKNAVESREKINRVYLNALIIGMKINKTHNDCLQGSAELPESVLKVAGVERYKSVSVYNRIRGGVADTYAVPIPEGVVMTTGAMASFASIGEEVNIASFIVSNEENSPRIIYTDGTKQLY